MVRCRTRASVAARMKKLQLEHAQTDSEYEYTTAEEDNQVEHEEQPVTVESAMYSIKSQYHANEDRLIRHDNGMFQCYAAIDGHGGDAASIFIQSNLVSIIETILIKHSILTRKKTRTNRPIVHDEIVQYINEAIKTLEHQFCKMAKKKGDDSGACVVAMVILDKFHAFIANVGDCRAVLLDDLPIPLSTDHKSKCIEEQKRIEEAGGRVINDRLCGVLDPSRAIGDLDLKTPDKRGQLIATPEIQYLRLVRGQTIVLATDGVWDILSNEQVAELVDQLRQTEFPLSDFRQYIARSVTEQANTAANHDDISLVLLECLE